MIRVAIIGTGSIAHSHAAAYASFSERCKVVALINRHEDKAILLRDKFQFDCKVMQDYKELLHEEDIDLVSICTPPQMHAEIASDLLSAGKHVLVEKPMAMSLEECDQMLAAAAESGCILSVVGQNRFHEPNWNLKHILDSGLPGKIVHAQVDSYHWRGESYYDLWWRGTWEQEGGGCTLNHGVHHMDMLLWMMGMPQSVQAVMSNTSHPNSEVEDISIAILSYADGSLAQITSSVIHHGEERQMVFQGEHARISSPWKVYASTAKDNGFPERNPALETEIEAYRDGIEPLLYSGFEGQVDNVLTAIENGSHQVLIDGQDGRNVLELITAVYEASITKQPVSLPLAKDNPFYTREGLLAHAPRFNAKTRPALKASEQQ
ncbi:Gfo/Idh/MocA family protein [Paenibacillus woosongensis]|uniref:Gfo/Idh/MocA family protein n=1 Tax=Paenibacillus TaxID=44249 RepID=UPI001BCAA03D|nr:Gfo/Idh/MocA family oxidoreductase [Paenibacillus woosongensis]